MISWEGEFGISHSAKPKHLRLVQCRERKQAAYSSVGRLLTLAVLSVNPEIVKI